MMTEKTKRVLLWTFVSIGAAVMITSAIFVICLDNSDTTADKDLYRTIPFLGWAIMWLGAYFEPISTRQLENGPGCFLTSNLVLLLLIPFSWIIRIEHFTVPVVTMLTISAMLTIVDGYLIYKKSRQLKAQIDADKENAENQG